MMNPSVDDLVRRVDSRYSLVTVISKRARQLIEGEEPLIEVKGIKPVSIAIEEFRNYKIKIVKE